MPSRMAGRTGAGFELDMRPRQLRVYTRPLASRMPWLRQEQHGTRRAGWRVNPAQTAVSRRELVQRAYVTDADLSKVRGHHGAARSDGFVVPDVVSGVRAAVAARAAKAADRRAYSPFAASSSYAFSSTPFNVSEPPPW